MLYKFIYYIFKLFPAIKQFFWKKWYTIFAEKVESQDLKFMNYGYSSSNLELVLDSQDERYIYPIQLYNHVASQISLKGLKVLEVGSGRGGGASYITRYLDPAEMVGLDLSPSAVNLCNKIYDFENLNFIQGSAEELPFDDNTFDAVINVESSHCYMSMKKFISEVSRVLKPEAYFLFCDLRRDIYINEMLSEISSNGLSLVSYKDISSNIITATTKMSTERRRMIDHLKPGLFKRILESFAAVKGSKVHQSFADGYLQYISAICINSK